MMFDLSSSNLQKQLYGLHTAIITPFKDNRIDFGVLETLIERQIASGVNGIVFCGSTGESPTLSHKEHNELIALGTKIINNRILSIGGTGSNSTVEAIELTKQAESVGCDVALLVVPYYNKPTQECLYQHFKSIHDATNINIILYNVPGRTIVDLSNDTIYLLSLLPRIIGIKDATGNLDRVPTLRNLVGNNFVILSGEDMTALAFNASGGDGIISVTSNIIPETCKKLQTLSLSHNIKEAYEIQQQLTELNIALFCEANPIPVKYASFLMGLSSNEIRLPLLNPSISSKQLIYNALDKIGIKIVNHDNN